jgi:hypothetical protein
MVMRDASSGGSVRRLTGRGRLARVVAMCHLFCCRGTFDGAELRRRFHLMMDKHF